MSQGAYKITSEIYDVLYMRNIDPKVSFQEQAFKIIKNKEYEFFKLNLLLKESGNISLIPQIINAIDSDLAVKNYDSMLRDRLSNQEYTELSDSIESLMKIERNVSANLNNLTQFIAKAMYINTHTSFLKNEKIYALSDKIDDLLIYNKGNLIELEKEVLTLRVLFVKDELEKKYYGNSKSEFYESLSSIYYLLDEIEVSLML